MPMPDEATMERMLDQVTPEEVENRMKMLENLTPEQAKEFIRQIIKLFCGGVEARQIYSILKFEQQNGYPLYSA